MSRLSDALRRAGQPEDAQNAAVPDDIGAYAAEDPIATTQQLQMNERGAGEPTLSEGYANTEVHSETDSGHAVGPRLHLKRPTPIGVARRETTDDVPMIDVIWTLYRRRWLVAAVIAVSVVAAMIYNRTATKVYEAHARLLLEPNSADVVQFRSLTTDLGRLDYYVTQLEVLRSPTLARRTLEKLHLLDADSAGQAGQVGQLLRGLTVAPIKSELGESRVISVTFKSPSPELAAGIANGIAQTYVDQLLEDRRQGSRTAAAWLNQRLAELRSEVQANEGALQHYREQKDSVSLGDQQNIVVQKLAQLNALVTSARTERLEKQAVYEQLKAIREDGEPLDTFFPILGNSFIQGLKADLAGLQRERQQLSERLGELHPDMIRVNTSIATAERRLKEEMAKVVDGIQNDYKAAQAKERSLNIALEDQKRAVLNLSQQSIGYSALQRDSSSTQQMLQTVLQRAKETELSVEQQSTNARILDTADIPRGAFWPRTQLNLIVALFGGGFLGVVLAFGLEYVNPRLTDPADIADALGLPLLGITPQVPRLNKRPAIFDTLPSSFQEALRVIRTRIFLSPIAGTVRSMAVTSTNPGEGKSVVASNLAVSIAMAGRRVLLVDADMRRPQMHRIFNVPRSPGLSDVINGEAKSTEAVLESSVKGLFLLAAGASVTNPTEVLDREHLRHLIQELSQAFDVVVLDCPPVMAVADASIIANVASSVLFVVGAGLTSRKAALLAVDRITAVQGQVVGVVLNKAKVSPRSEYALPKYVVGDADTLVRSA